MSTDLPLKKDMEFHYGVARELVPGVKRIVAENPSPFTFKGTNTYVIGSDELAVVDPGPAIRAHIDAIMATTAGRPITHVFITHTHRDHTDGLEMLLERTRKSADTKTCAYGRTALNPGAVGVTPSGTEFLDADFNPDIVMREGDAISGPDWSMQAIFTPGHAPDHLCFAMQEAGEDTGVVFSGDHIMSWNTTVVAPPEGSMAEYMASLEKLLQRDDKIFLPGHGGQIDKTRRVVRAFMVHRQWREQAILSAIRDGSDTIEKIVALVYQGLDDKLIKAASLSVLAHVEHLMERNLATYSDGGESVSGDASVFARPLAPV